nr:serine/threonine protein kinase [Kineosporia mesophila]
MEASDPDSVGPYRLAGRLGQGGMGRVYLGRTAGGRPVAVKVIAGEFERHPESLARFRREVEILGTVRNAFTAALIDSGVQRAPYWLATEYVPGPTLSAVIEEHGALDPDVCRGLFAALAEGLADIHAHRVSHRDLKPQNIILSVTGPQLIDFGIARDPDQPGVTQVGMAIGTPGYTAPEALSGHETGPAADIFALGATMAAAATGRAPYGRGSGFMISQRSLSGDVDVDGVPGDLAALIRACSAAEPGSRPGAGQIVAHCRPETSLIENPSYQSLLASIPSSSGAPAQVPARVPEYTPDYGPDRTEVMAPAAMPYDRAPRAASPSEDWRQTRSRPAEFEEPSSWFRNGPLMAVGAVLLVIVGVVAAMNLVGGKEPDLTPVAISTPDAAAAEETAAEETAPVEETAEAEAEEAAREKAAREKAEKRKAARQKAREQRAAELKAQAEAKQKAMQTLTGPGDVCVAVPGTRTNGDLPTMQPCDGSPAQRWSYTAEGALSAQGMCLDVGAGDVSNGHQVQVWGCNSTPAQIFQANGDDGYGHSMLQNAASGRCLTTPTDVPQSGAALMLWDCAGNQNQSWRIP